MATRNTQTTVPRTLIGAWSATKPFLVALALWIVAATLLLYAVLDIRPASAQSACGNRTDILSELAKYYSERPQAMGLSADGKVVEVLASSTGNWTILVNYPGGQTCVVAVGENWEILPAVAAGPSA